VTADGALAGDKFQVNQFAENGQTAPRVTRWLDGRFAVTWTSLSQPGGEGADVMVRCYSADSSPVSEESIVDPLVAGNQRAASVAAFDDTTQRFVAVWQSQDGPSDPGWGIRARIYDKKCQPIGAAFTVNATTDGDQHTPHIATALPVGGGFTVAWTGLDSSGAGTQLRRFDSDGLPIGVDQALNTLVTGDQSVRALVDYPDGSVLAGWDSPTAGDLDAVVFRRYAPDGLPATLPFLGNLTFDGDNHRPSATVLTTGQTLVLWQSADPGDVSHIVGRRLPAP